VALHPRQSGQAGRPDPPWTDQELWRDIRTFALRGIVVLIVLVLLVYKSLKL